MSNLGDGRKNNTAPKGVPGIGLEFVPTDEDRERVKKYAGMGIPLQQVRTQVINPATGKCITIETLIKCFKDEIDVSRSDVNNMVIGRLFAKCLEGDQKALQLWVNTQIKPRLKSEMVQYEGLQDTSNSLNAIKELIEMYTASKEKEIEY